MADSKNLPENFAGYKLASLDELTTSLDFGDEVNFFLRGRWYLIESHGARKMIAQCPDGDPAYFDGWDDLFAGYLGAAIPSGSLWHEFEIETL